MASPLASQLATQVSSSFGSSPSDKQTKTITLMELYFKTSEGKLYKLEDKSDGDGYEFLSVDDSDKARVLKFFDEALKGKQDAHRDVSKESDKLTEGAIDKAVTETIKKYDVRSTTPEKTICINEMNETLRREDVKTSVRELKQGYSTDEDFDTHFKSFLNFFDLVAEDAQQKKRKDALLASTT